MDAACVAGLIVEAEVELSSDIVYDGRNRSRRK